MKLKKILAALAATTMVATAFSGITAFAASYGTPEFTLTFSDVYEDGGTMCVDVTVGYKNFENFAAYVGGKKKSGKGIAALSVELTYDQNKLEYYGGEKKISSGLTTVGSSKPVIAGAYAGEAILTASEQDIVTFWFGFTGDVEPVTMTIDNYEFTIRDIAQGTTADEIYGSAKDDKFTNGDASFSNEEAPVTEYVNVTTDGNVEGVSDGQVEKGSKIAVSAKEVAGKTAKLYANGEEIVDGAEYTFDADVSFTVVYEDIVAPATYTYSFANAGYRPGKTDEKEDVFYKLNINTIAEGAAALVATVAEKDFSVPLAAPVVEGATDVEFTFVFVGVPVSVFGTDTILEKFTAFGTDNQEYVKADAQ